MRMIFSFFFQIVHIVNAVYWFTVFMFAIKTRAPSKFGINVCSRRHSRAGHTRCGPAKFVISVSAFSLNCRLHTFIAYFLSFITHRWFHFFRFINLCSVFFINLCSVCVRRSLSARCLSTDHTAHQRQIVFFFFHSNKKKCNFLFHDTSHVTRSTAKLLSRQLWNSK